MYDPNDTDATIGQVMDGVVRRQGGADALVYFDRKLRLSYREFRAECRRAARGLMAIGVRKGDHVGVWAPNRPEWVVLQFALARIGAVLVTINTQVRPYELEYLLRQSDAHTLILADGFRDLDYPATVHEICPETRTAAAPGALRSEEFPRLRNVVFLGDRDIPGMIRWDDVLALGGKVPDDALAELERACDPDDVVVLMYTSGTTGFPKGVMLTHRNLVSDALRIADCMALGEKDRMCIPVPFFHCFGCVMGTLCCVTRGAAMVPVETFSAKAVLESVSAERCTALHGVPTMFIAELEELAANPGAYDLGSLRTGIMAGAPCPVEVMKSVVDRMNMKEITIAYGLTEASPVITQTRTDEPIEIRVSTAGRALPGVEVRIVDPETHRTLPAGARGELATRGFHVMKGYYKMPEDTARAVDPDGWLYTGDLAVMDAAGYCRITGCSKDMIVRGGENISPREIEEFLHTHPAVLDVQVVGVPSGKYGEVAAACVRIRPGFETVTPGEIAAYCRDNIARYKVPGHVVFVDEYPKTASGKIQKHKLRDEMTRRLGLESPAAAANA